MKVFMNNVSLKYFEMQPRATIKQLWWHDTLALLGVKSIQKLGRDNVVPNVLNHKKDF
jgi:hypothetical protein